MGDSAHTTHHTDMAYKPRKKISTTPFSRSENIFQKSAAMVVGGIAIKLQPSRRFLKNVHIFEKRGGADAFENDPSFISKGTVRF
jgi:hypothetical protein